MSCKEQIRYLIQKCGREVRFQTEGGEKRFLAYLNPVRERADKIVPTESGVFHQGKWLILLADKDAKVVRDGVIFYSGEDTFYLERAEKVFFGKELVYLWGMVQKVQGGDGNR